MPSLPPDQAPAKSERDAAHGPRRRPASRFSRALSWVAIVAPFLGAAASAAGGCSSDEASSTSGPASSVSTTVGTGGSGGSGGSSENTGGSGGDTSGLSGRELFEATVQPGLVENCAVCHATAGIADFLGGNDIYATITSYKSGTTDEALIWPVANQSILYTYPDSPDHNGVHFEPDLTDLKQAVLTWLTKEALNLPTPEAGPIDYIVPFKPILGGLNAIYLNPLGPEYENSAITFIANELGSPPSLLQLSNLQVYPAGIVLRLVHPRFSVYEANTDVGHPDPVDSLASIDQTFVPQQDPTLGTGEIILANWEKDARLALDFSQGKIESFILGADGGIVVNCNNVSAYQSAVTSLGTGGPMYCAQTCHGGAKAEAQAAMDLSGLIASPPDYDTACANMRARITPKDVESSQIVLVTNPTQQVIHMYKFNGNVTAYNAFKTGMTPWIMAE